MQYWLLLYIEEREGDIIEKMVSGNGGERQWRLDELVTNKWLFILYLLSLLFNPRKLMCE